MNTAPLPKLIEELPDRKRLSLYDKLCQKVPLMPIKTKVQHRAAKQMLSAAIQAKIKRNIRGSLINEVNDYIYVLSRLVEEFEKGQLTFGVPSGLEMLRYLIELHNLRQSDLENEIGKQSVVSDILNGKRKLTTKHIKKLSKRFGVDPSVFFPD
jgi:HTH-type transcriptional regulator / antitoxin HigA